MNDVDSFETIESDSFWGDFDISESDRKALRDYILSKATFRVNENCGDRKRHYLIYLITNKLDGRIYVGQHTTDNINDGYMGSGTYIKRSQKRLGMENFDKTILFDFDNFEDMDFMEMDIVNKEFCSSKHAYNKSLGGFSNDMIRTAGKRCYHSPDMEEQDYFYEGKAPEGWIKGGLPRMKGEHLRQFNFYKDELKKNGFKFCETRYSFPRMKALYENMLKQKAALEEFEKTYTPMYEFYIENGYDAVKKKFGLEIALEEFLRRCKRYVKNYSSRGRWDKNERLCREMYEEYVKNGYKGVVEKFGYTHSRETLVKRILRVVEDYDSTARKNHVWQEQVDYFTKIYEEYKVNGYKNIKEKFGCTLNHRFLRRQMEKYVKDYKPRFLNHLNRFDCSDESKMKTAKRHMEIKKYYDEFGFENTKEKYDLKCNETTLRRQHRRYSKWLKEKGVDVEKLLQTTSDVIN